MNDLYTSAPSLYHTLSLSHVKQVYASIRLLVSKCTFKKIIIEKKSANKRLKCEAKYINIVYMQNTSVLMDNNLNHHHKI